METWNFYVKVIPQFCSVHPVMRIENHVIKGMNVHVVREHGIVSFHGPGKDIQ